MGARAALYARISLDRHEGEGVGRQLDDCRTLATDRGWQVVAEYVDNDISAWRAKRRPEWDRLLSDATSGAFDVIVAWHVDRLYRRLPDLSDLIEAVKITGVDVATVRAGDIDLSTATGRMVAGILGSVAAAESERIGEKVARAKAQRAAQGRPAGGGSRAFGFAADKLTLVPDEAALLAGIAERIAAGASIYAEAQALNEAGLRTASGSAWSPRALRRLLTSPRIAGLRSYHGEIVGAATWPAIIDRDTWERVCASLASRRRPPSRARQEWLLTGLIGCPHCGRPLYGQAGSRRAYACASGPGYGCGGVSVSAEATDAKVIAAVEGWLARPAMVRAFHEHLAGGADQHEARTELASIEQRRQGLAERWASGEMGDAEYDTARTVLAQRQAKVETLLVAGPAAPVGDIVARWREAPVRVRRDLVAVLVRCPMPLRPGRMADPADRLTVEPGWR